METTDGTLLGGRLRYAQPRDGYRTGIEPVLLAAAVPARPGDRVIEAGTGAGAGLMCLAARVPGIRGLGVELDPAMAGLARANAGINGLGLEIVTGDVTAMTLPDAEHAMANPPWHDPRSTGSPLRRRRLALQESGQGIEAWIAAMAGTVTGSLTMIVSAGMVPRCLAALDRAGMGRVTALTLLPKEGRPAKLAIVQGWRGAAAITALEAVLHAADGRYTQALEAVLRGGAPLPLADQGGENRRLPLP